MQIDVSDLRATIVPKSDQLNAEQLLGGPMTITVTGVQVSSSAEQPVVVYYEADNGRPFKPCKTMRKILVFAWGPDGNEWAGKSMTVYNDPSVKFGGDEVGGIRISHMSHIPKAIQVSLTSTRGKKALYSVALLELEDAKFLGQMRAATDLDELKAIFGRAWKAVRSDTRRASLKQAYDQRVADLQKSADGDPPNGPPTGADQGTGAPGAMDEGKVAKKLREASTVEALDYARSLIAEVSSEDARGRLKAFAAERDIDINTVPE